MTKEELLTQKRHTLAHILAKAVLETHPKALLTLGPAIDTGFYYDIDFKDGSKPSTEEDLVALTKRMKEIVKEKLSFDHKEVSLKEALDAFDGNPYKQEIISEIEKKGEKITLYTVGDFTDLCRGGHVENTKDIEPDSFKVSHIAGAYWRGDEKNAMLTRIYGLAFDTKEELDAYITQQEEAKKRDHRVLGKQLGLFVFSELVGPGLPLWTPRGTLVRELLNDYVWELRKKAGYEKVTIPHITKKNLYEKSGHWAKYAEDLFKVQTRDGHLFAMKPMNCPHHTQIFDAEQRSYRDMPKRYCETTMVYRDEQSGELAGLTRVLSITQDDAHVFCRESQLEAEMENVWNIVQTFYKTFGFALTPRFSRRDPKTPEKYLGTPENWDKAEDAIKNLITKKSDAWIDGEGEAAFYGPKIDFMALDAIGRKHQVATIQADFVQPENFNLYCINEKGEKERIVMIHCAIMGSIERFTATYLEHCAGNFPTWLSPTQVSIVPIGEKHQAFADELKETMKNLDIRVALDASSESLGKRIRNAKTNKVPYVVVLGDKEVESKALTIETRSGEKLEGISVAEFLERLQIEIKNRS